MSSILPKSLEMEFMRQYEEDLYKECDFEDYLIPNEPNVHNVVEHLEKAKEPGIVVSTGTERSFFNLSLISREKSLGLVVRDINPKVKMYVDCNLLLLKLAENREDYKKLSTCNREVITIAEKIEEIRNRLLKSSEISDFMKGYYQKHLTRFAQVYFIDSKYQAWREHKTFSSLSKYFDEDILFQRIHVHAKNGNIIATVGDIGDLRFLDQYRISVLDTSNIKEYSLIQLKTGSFPVVISTTAKFWLYESCVHEGLTVEEELKGKNLLTIFEAIFTKKEKPLFLSRDLHDMIARTYPHFLIPSYFSREYIAILEHYKNSYLIEIPLYGFVNTHKNFRFRTRNSEDAFKAGVSKSSICEAFKNNKEIDPVSKQEAIRVLFEDV